MGFGVWAWCSEAHVRHKDIPTSCAASSPRGMCASTGRAYRLRVAVTRPHLTSVLQAPLHPMWAIPGYIASAAWAKSHVGQHGSDLSNSAQQPDCKGGAGCQRFQASCCTGLGMQLAH